MTEPNCKKCQQVSKEAIPELGGILYEDDLWIVVHKGDPIGVPGHLQLVAKRHVVGYADFTDAESAAVGPILTKCQRALLKASSAPRIYSAALGASFPHFHAHMVPVYDDGVQAVTGTAWDVFLQEKLAADGKLQVDRKRCAEICEAFKVEMLA
mmetsp:Transcript_33016/g.93472  ORF Transcript_33016/g.93472 Transcript_33016/m.93472 type:complete len:154 (+) Transcript_33016:77-538(+)